MRRGNHSRVRRRYGNRSRVRRRRADPSAQGHNGEGAREALTQPPAGSVGLRRLPPAPQITADHCGARPHTPARYRLLPLAAPPAPAPSPGSSDRAAGSRSLTSSAPGKRRVCIREQGFASSARSRGKLVIAAPQTEPVRLSVDLGGGELERLRDDQAARAGRARRSRRTTRRHRSPRTAPARSWLGTSAPSVRGEPSGDLATRPARAGSASRSTAAASADPPPIPPRPGSACRSRPHPAAPSHPRRPQASERSARPGSAPDTGTHDLVDTGAGDGRHSSQLVGERDRLEQRHQLVAAIAREARPSEQTQVDLARRPGPELCHRESLPPALETPPAPRRSARSSAGWPSSHQRRPRALTHVRSATPGGERQRPRQRLAPVCERRRARARAPWGRRRGRRAAQADAAPSQRCGTGRNTVRAIGPQHLAPRRRAGPAPRARRSAGPRRGGEPLTDLALHHHHPLLDARAARRSCAGSRWRRSP